MRVELAGLGYWGAKLLRNLVSIVGVDGVVAVDLDPELRRRAEKSFPGLQTSPSHTEALQDDRVLASFIATPAGTHARLALEAIDAGRHVFVEKPLTSSVADAQKVVSRARRRGVLLMTGHTFLFSPAIERIVKYLEEGEVGRIHYIASSRLNLGLYREDANVVWDLAPHDFSIICRLMDDFPVLAQTAARAIVRPGIPDVAFVNLTFPSGAIASVSLSWLAPRKTRSTVIVADSKMICFDESHVDEPVKVYDRGVVVNESPEFAANSMTYRYGETVAPVISTEEPLAVELSHFLHCVRTGEPCRSDGEFGLRIVEVLAAADASWQCGGMPVAVGSGEIFRGHVDRVIDLTAGSRPAIPAARSHATGLATATGAS